MTQNIDLRAYFTIEKERHEEIYKQHFDILKKHFGSQINDELRIILSQSSNINYLVLEEEDSVNHRQIERKKIEKYLSLLEKAYELKQQIQTLSDFTDERICNERIKDVYFYDLIQHAEQAFKLRDKICLEDSDKALSTKQIHKIKEIKKIFVVASSEGLTKYKAFEIIRVLLGYADSSENNKFIKRAILSKNKNLQILIVKDGRPVKTK